MVSIYYLCGFNNYYNRTILLPQSTLLADYDNYLLKVDEVENFNPNDNVMTQLVVNYWEEDIPDITNVDYVLISTDSKTIDSKWFALDRQRIRGQQWQFTLRRDLVSDNYEAVVNAPCFIEKATLSADSPLLWNQEDMTFNQIKKDEILLKDGSGCPWIVGYYAKNTNADYLHGTVDANDLDKAYDELIDVSFANWKYNATTNAFNGLFSDIEYRIYAKSMTTSTGFQSQQGYLRFDKNGNYNGWKYTSESNYSLTANFKGPLAGEELEPTFKSSASTLKSLIPSYVNNTNTEASVRDFLSYNGLTIKDSEGKYYSLSIYTPGYEENVVDIPSGNLFNNINNIVEQGTIITGTANTSSYKVLYKRPKYMMIATELTNRETTWDMTGDKLITDDAPYNIFAIPFGNTQIEQDGYAVATSNSVMAMAVANSIIRVMGENLYDIQLLPYCPINTPMVISATGIGLLTMYDIDAYSIVKLPGDETLENHPCYILNVPKAKFSKNINYTIDVPTSAVERKVMNECEMYRLCSPNYNGAFEFSPAKNNGVEWFNVDCEYKPFQPYIHINPNFGGMYGRDFDDARGLICNGDFSLTQIKDAWQNYQIQNKNYQEIFSRQIENMEITNKVQRDMEIAQAIAGGVSATAMGAGSGMMIGGASHGPLGAGIGAVLGAGTSIAGGIADVYLGDKLRAEALDMTKDMFGYNLGNIQALPYTLTKVSSYNNNNKLFPFVEVYSATEIEKQAFRDKLAYDGMTTMIIGKIADYRQAEPSYIKGRLIRLMNSETLDFHGLSELSNEIYKGVFI